MRSGRREFGSRALVMAAMLTTVAVLAPLPVRAQDDLPVQTEAAARTKVHRIGPLSVTPTVTLQDIGVDSNIYNGTEPTPDFTFTLVPVVQASGRVLRLATSLRSSSDLVYFEHQASERSLNEDLTAAVRLPLGRVDLIGTANYLNTRQRPTEEIDARSRRVGYSGSAGMNVRLTPKTSGRVSLGYLRTAFDGDAVFNGSSLARELNRQATRVSTAIRSQLTPLTALEFAGEVSRSRFTEAHVRDANSAQASVALELQPRALIAGDLRVGYQRFAPVNAGLPSFAGPVGSADLTYRVLGSVIVGVSAGRSLEYSYSEELPYYVRQGWGASVRQHFLARWDAWLSAGRYEHRYRPAAGTAFVGRSITDRLADLSLGTGYQAGPSTRVTVVSTYRRRQSSLILSGYNSVRLGASVSFAF